MKTLQDFKYLFADCEPDAKILEGKINTAIAIGILSDYPMQVVFDFLEQTEWLTQRDRMHIVFSAMAILSITKRLDFTNIELDTIRFCVSKMLEVNKLEHGEMCASILTGDYDRTEEFQRVLTKLSTLK